MVDHVMRHIEELSGVQVMRGCEPREVRKRGDGSLAVLWHDSHKNQTMEVHILSHASYLIGQLRGL